MQWLNAVLTAVLVTAGYYGMLYTNHDRYGLELKRRGKWIVDKAALVTGVLTLTGAGALSLVRLPLFSLPQYLLTMALLSGMAFLAVADYQKNIIPNRVLAAMGLLWAAVAGLYLILDLEQGFALLSRSLAGAAIGGLIFLLCYLVSRGQLGAGDVKLAFILGLYLTGERIMGGILYGSLLCCGFSVIHLLRRKITVKDGVPMAPFLYLGVLITLFIA